MVSNFTLFTFFTAFKHAYGLDINIHLVTVDVSKNNI